MLPIKPESIDLLRYLLVLRISQPLVTLPPSLPVELSYVLGSIITERLPTGRVKLWRKMQTAWEEANPAGKRRQRKSRWPLRPPALAWPLELAWLPYTPKEVYGKDEPLLCELKLFGESASHPLFLELILPALEEAGAQGDSRWKRPRSLWGRFNVEAVYAARGSQWEAMATDGKLNFSYRPTPNQWAEGLSFGAELGVSATQLEWITPYQPAALKQPAGQGQGKAKQAKLNAPTIAELLPALAARLDVVAPGWAAGEERETALDDVIALAEDIESDNKAVKTAPKYWPGLVWGRQRFSLIPPALLPYLELASILHIGQNTHFGCGVFRLS